MKYKPFKEICTSCSICCYFASTVPNFPEPVDETGKCMHLKEDRTCAIYDTRPKICRVDDSFELVKHKFKSKDDYIKLTIDTCNKMIIGAGMEDKYLIDEEKAKI